MYPTLCKVDFWDEDKRCIVSENILIYADSFAEAAQRMEEYYGKEMESLAINMYEEGGIFRVTDEEAKAIVERMF